MKISNGRKKNVFGVFLLSAAALTTLSCTNEEIDVTEDTLESSSAQEVSRINTNGHKEHHFNNSALWPFSEDAGYTGSQIFREGMGFYNDGRGGKRLKITWLESEYDGTRRERGHEIKLHVNTNKELYTGFYFNVPKGQSNNLLNKNTIIWQLYNWNTAGCSNWTAHLELKKNDLYLSYRSACVNPTTVKVYDNIPTDRDIAFQIRSVLSGNRQGRIVIYMDGKTVLKRTGINLGFGSFDSNDKARTSVAGVKMGMYCADTGNYTNNEKRILYLDNVASANRSGTVQNSLNRIDPRR